MTTSKGSPPRKLTLRQQRFVEALPTAPSQAAAARIAGYSDVAEGAKVRAVALLTNPNVQAAIATMQQATTSEKVMTILRRKERLSELTLPDPEHPDPVKAIAELNRMERVYGEPQPTPSPQQTNILVLLSDPQTRALLEALAERLSGGGDGIRVLVDGGKSSLEAH